ncbi:MAG: O-antigen ligase family protein [Planctomycetota bacterium]
MQWVGCSAIVSAAFGLVHTLCSNGKHFWFYEVPHARPEYHFSGAFTNPNHFANLLVLGVGPLAAWVVLRDRADRRSGERERRGNSSNTRGLSAAAILGYGALGLVVLTITLTASRGGVIALGTATAALLAGLHYRSLMSVRHVAGIGTIILALLATASLYGFDRLEKRLQTLVAGNIEEVDFRSGRRTVWQANLTAFTERPVTGTGAGSHRDAHAAFVPKHNGVVYTHAENGYLQILSETGLAGAILLMIGVGFVVYWCMAAISRSKEDESAAYAVAATAGLAASLTHSLVDFVWYIPGCMGPTLILAACQLRLAQIASQNRRAQGVILSGYAGWALTACIVFIATWSVAAYSSAAIASVHWDRYSRLAIADQEIARSELLRSSPRPETHALRVANAEAMIRCLRAFLSYRHDSARVHSVLATRYTQLFDLRQTDSENALSVAQLRDTVDACGFTDLRQLQEWLQRAIGENLELLVAARKHALLSIHYCPMNSGPYLKLADTGFLAGQSSEVNDALLEQALRVRPKSPRVLYTVGAYKFNHGQPDRGEELWKRSYDTPGSHRLRIIRTLAYQTSASYFLDTFRPRWDSLEHVWKFFRESQSEAELVRIVDYAARAARNEPPLERLGLEGRKWVKLSEMQAAVGRPELATRALEEGYRRAPTVWTLRRSLGIHLAQAERLREAEPHLRWCLGRQPQDEAVQQALVEAAKERLAAMRNDDSAWK